MTSSCVFFEMKRVARSLNCSDFGNLQSALHLPNPNGLEVVSHPVTARTTGGIWHRLPSDLFMYLMPHHLFVLFPSGLAPCAIVV